ncbi:MAG: hypothetical protein K2J01_03595 [Clostridiales bacterium]|nr:hypothetical protein [Clostridiales bacterium]
MKKLGLIKRIGLTATTLFVCLAMLITCFTFVAPRAARAEGDENLVTPTTSEKVDVAKGVKVKDKCDYGDEFTVPADATVTAPNGDEVTATGGKVTATQLGVYKVSYTEEGISYNFKVSVSLKEDYFLFIKYNGADIPTYVEKGTQFTLPEASVKYYDENNILRDYPDKDYTIEIADSKNHTYGEDKTFKAEDDGKVFITYTATLGKEGGTKRLTKTFTVNVQSKVNKSGNPSLAVSGMTQTASVNRPVTLPVAKVSDKSDDNVKVVIEVLDPDNNKVNNVKVNDDGYAYETIADDPVQFDNDKTMTFYPTKTGDYKVRYTAYNDFYDEANPSAGGKSGTNEGIIKVADHVAPVFKNTDKYEYLIPEKWGMDVKDEAGKSVDMQGKVKFLIPELVDNKCHMPKDADDKDDLISLYFRITDSENSKTVLSITNILSTGDDGKFTKNDVYTEDATFNNDDKAFVFDFSKYVKKNSKGEAVKSKAGTYTVLFRARDKDNNTSSKTYTITLTDTYEDKNIPNTAEVTAPDYISAADETFTVPYPVYADKEDTRLLVDYRLYTAEDKSIPVKGGEVASLTAKPGYLVINEGKDDEAELELGDNLYYYIGVTDKAGNFRSNAVADDKSYIDVAATPADYTKIAAVTKIIKEAETEGKFAFDGTKIKFVNTAKDSTDTTPIKVGDTVNAGSFVITAANKDMRNYTGFEVAVYDPEGNHVDVTLETLSDVKDDVAKIYVQNIIFTATSAAKAAEGEEEEPAYTMTIRVFDVNGNNDVYGYKLTGVNPSTHGNNQTSAIANVDTKGEVNVKYNLKNSVIKHISEQGDFRVVRKITGGIFSLMGNEFTAKTAQSYRVWDGYINADNINREAGSFNYDDVTQVDIPYSVQVIDDATPVIELQGTMPSYKAKYDAEKGEYSETNGLVKLPTAVAYTQYGMGTVTIDVKDPDGQPVTLDENNQFKADKDGAYKVTFTAVYENGNQEELIETISVGDVFAPKFTVSGGTSTASAKKEGDTFTFKNIELAEGESTDGVTITKQIYDPSHELISGSTVDGTYTSYATKGNNGSEIKLNKVGEYTIVYTAKDAVGNDYKITETLTVTSQGSSTPTTWTTLSTVLIIVAIVLLAGVIIYVVRFRKVKK